MGLGRIAEGIGTSVPTRLPPHLAALPAGGWCSAAGCASEPGARAGAQRRSRFFSVGGCGARGRVWAGEVGSGPRRMDHRLGFLDSNKSEPVVGATTQLSPLGLNLNSDGGTFPTSQCHIWFSSFSKQFLKEKTLWFSKTKLNLGHVWITWISC